MSGHPKVSVVVPTYNRTGFLRAALASALAQTLQDFEIIVVDDASQSDTEKVIRQFEDNRITLIRHETNQGVSAARNTGVASSKGKYIAFLDDDDEWLPHKLEKQLRVLENNPSVGVVYTGSFAIDASSRQIVNQLMPKERGYLFEKLCVQKSIAPTSSFLLRKHCFEKVGLFDPYLEFGEDFDMWLRISKEFEFEYLEEPLVRFSVADGRCSLSANYEVMIRGKEAQLRKHAYLFAQDSKNYSRCYLGLGVLHCYSGNVKKGRESFIKAIKIYPFEPRHYFNLFLSVLGAKNFKKWKILKEDWLAR